MERGGEKIENMNKDIEKIDRLKSLIMGASTDVAIDLTNEKEYKELRSFLINSKVLNIKVPALILSCGTLKEFRREMQDLGGYKVRRDKIKELFAPYYEEDCESVTFPVKPENPDVSSEKRSFPYQPLVPVDPILKKNNSNKVFIVHGHNNLIKEKTARTLEKLGLEAIILHEQADGGKTIIEKFENNAISVGFAIILLTDDDEGKAKEEVDYRKRARQNVIFEMGYFMGKLGRERVLLLLDKGVEKPGDLDGIVYTPIDEHDAWKIKLVKEMKSVGYSISADDL